MTQQSTSLDPKHYAYTVMWSQEDGEYVATCAEFPSLSWLAKSQAKALSGLEGVIAETLQDLAADGEPLPEPIAARRFSGKFNLRVGESLHRRLALEAAREELSLNQYIVRKLAQPGA